jgi:hypothetical protein
MVTFALQFLLFFSSQSFASTLVVADIDDTLKVSFVRSSVGAAKYLRLQRSFSGMKEVLNELQLNSNSTMIYLSNAPKRWIGPWHEEFLNLHAFPGGALILREDLPSETHKITQLRNIRDSLDPQKMILIGDNGERDAEIYSQFAQESPGLEIHSFVHQIYSSANSKYPGKKLASNQVGFVSSLDLAMQLADRGKIEGLAFESLADQLLRLPLLGPDSFPDWLDCADYRWTVSEGRTTSREGFKKYQQDLMRRCANPKRPNEIRYEGLPQPIADGRDQSPH